MIYVSGAMCFWFVVVTMATLIGIYKEKRANKFDVFIGFILAPGLAFAAAFVCASLL